MRRGEDVASRYELELRETLAGAYDESYVAEHGPWVSGVEIAIVRDALKLCADDVLADFGSGTGRISRALAPHCRQVIAIDRSPKSLQVLEERAREHGLRNITVVQADLTQPLTSDFEASKAVSVQLLQHIPTIQGRRTVLDNMKRVLARGGRCVVENEGFNLVRTIRGKPRTVARPDALFFHSFTGRELWDLLSAAGIRPIRTLGCGVFYWTHYALAPRTITRLDKWASFMPGADRVAKFTAILGAKP